MLAKEGPKGDLIATPSAWSKGLPLNRKRFSLTPKVSSLSIKFTILIMDSISSIEQKIGARINNFT